ncbi:hypothetical protein M8818_006224 [Zalaria obscura]|uniref:Uncharacterized protein n=1 Tax=Zalaria obscura TaxID=2024903 RepID=A0ACC3S934_9PEZI
MDHLIQVRNETEASIHRLTREGKKLTYKLKVLQQPERARACGAGAKSSADRRPVDPPPIVELRIFEGEGFEKDITFQLNANYFLFATLEQAREIAHGRVDPQRNAPVLTGTPVAGMVYLDRPSPAGYFIFPDLSVRHEGKYRLSFSLYEELKEDKDDDPADDNSMKAPGVDNHVTHRLEVRSVPFTVFSAKKFPGLSTSTNLSRTVAEQGCRVRIRRDVRMRRRDKGSGKDGYDDDTPYDRAKQAATPDAYGQSSISGHSVLEVVPRPRSTSVTSHASIAPAAPGQISRRTSLQDMQQGYQQGVYGTSSVGPTTPQGAYSQQSPYGQTSTQQYPVQYPVQQTQMQPPPMQYPQYNYSQPAPMPAQQSYYTYAPAPQQPQQPLQPLQPAPQQQYDSQAHTRQNSMDYASQMQQDYRRPSAAQTTSYGYTQQAPSMLSQQPSFNNTNTYNQPQSISQMRQPSISAMTSAPAMHPSTTSISLPPLNTTLPLPNQKMEANSPMSAIPASNYYDMQKTTAPLQPMQTAPELHSAMGKRTYSNSFDTRHLNGPLRQGARPSMDFGNTHTPHLYAEDGEDDEQTEFDRMRMSYRRADGREMARPLPPSI